MSEECLLRMRGIGKTFPGVKALDGVDFDLKPGEVHVLLGENGAGKSTLIKILAGAHTPDEGEIELEGKIVRIQNPHQALSLGVSVMYQEFNLVPCLTVAENIFLGREPISTSLKAINWNTMRNRAADILRGIDCDVNPNARVEQLGVAECQMVEIAKALSANARVIVMDEPTSSLSRDEITGLFKTIRKLKAQGIGIIYICHRIEEVFEVGDRATVLRDGQYVGTVDVREVDADSLIRMIVGRTLTEKFPYTERKIGEPLLAVKGLSRRGKLTNINLFIRRGEILGITGVMGAGRTELARAMFGADRIDSGQIELDGQPIKIRSPRDAICAGIGLLPEDRKTQGLALILPVGTNITLAALDRFVSTGVLRPRREMAEATQFIHRLRIRTPGIGTEVQRLSGGNQQKVVLAKWLCSNAKVVIFDEPTRGIDVGSKVEIYRLMNDLATSGGAVIMFSSDLPEVLGMSDRILVMKDGHIVAEFSRHEATQEKLMAAAM